MFRIRTDSFALYVRACVCCARPQVEDPFDLSNCGRPLTRGGAAHTRRRLLAAAAALAAARRLVASPPPLASHPPSTSATAYSAAFSAEGSTRTPEPVAAEYPSDGGSHWRASLREALFPTSLPPFEPEERSERILPPSKREAKERAVSKEQQAKEQQTIRKALKTLKTLNPKRGDANNSRKVERQLSRPS
eukprot:1180437-Prorocentrum_minimum.AAC.1